MVSTKSAEYLKYSPIWKKCRDIISGVDAVKNGGTSYLPQPSGMDKEEYKNGYLKRAEFFPATSRTHEGLIGLANAKKMMRTIPENFEDYLENVDGEGTTLDDFALHIFSDVIQTNYGGILVDAPSTNEISINEAEKMGLYPYMTFYPAEAIINVQTKTVNRNKIVTMVVLQETNNVPLPDDRFTVQPVTVYRVLELDKNGLYRQQIYNQQEELVNTVYPLKKGKYMDYIPFYFTPDRTPSLPMLENLAETNLAWYRKSADLENGLHWTGVPTPYSLGHNYQEGDEVIKLGGTQFVYFPADVTQVGYLEFGGAGLSSLQEAMTNDENRMAMLGASILATDKRGVESYETTKMRKAGEDSVLATFCNRISSAVSKAVKDFLEWTIGQDINDEVSVHINTDYDLNEMDASRLTSLISAWQTGGISKQTLFNNLKKGEIIDAEKTFEQEQEEIDEGGMVIPQL